MSIGIFVSLKFRDASYACEMKARRLTIYVMFVTVVATGLYYLFVEFHEYSTQTIYACLQATVEGC